jgi:signal transduction histidine kinase
LCRTAFPWVTVENTGPSIPASALPRLFEPFQQIADQGTHAAGGLGLGLAVAKAIADAHDALVTAHARQGGGLRVEVAFPSANCAVWSRTQVLRAHQRGDSRA